MASRVVTPATYAVEGIRRKAQITQLRSLGSVLLDQYIYFANPENQTGYGKAPSELTEEELRRVQNELKVAQLRHDAFKTVNEILGKVGRTISGKLEQEDRDKMNTDIINEAKALLVRAPVSQTPF